MTDEALRRAAEAVGIEPRYTDTWGRVHETTPEIARAILASLGCPAHDPAALEHTLAAREAERWRRAVDSTLVVREGADHLRVHLPASRLGASLKLEIQWEQGDKQHHWFWVPELKTIETAAVDGIDYVAKRLPLPKLRLGYHRILIYWMKAPELEVFAEARFIVCPPRAKEPEGRKAGLAISLYGLRSQRNWGCGDFTDLRALIDAFAPAGAAFIALNPLHAIANRQPYNVSPYLPECALYRNFIYLDVEQVGDPQLTEAEQREIAELRASQFVEYERIAALKLRALSRIYESFAGSAEFDAYCEGEGQSLEDYATYCALWEEMHRRDPSVWLWTGWPPEYQDPRSQAVAQFARDYRSRVQFFKFLQWNLAKQAAEAQAHALAKGMPIGLYHDLALATDRFGADLWADRPYYVTGCDVGAPPDELAPSGQDWGFPPPNRDHHKSDGYRRFAQSIRNAAAAGGALRIDHVMRFFRLYWIPHGFGASHGAYLRDYASYLLGIVALESHRGGFVVIGEDLGTVTPEVRAALAEAGILSYKVLWFERDEAGKFRAPSEYAEHALVCSTTHDLATLAGFFEGRDIEARRAAGLADANEYQKQRNARAQEIDRLEQALSDAGFPGDPLGFLLSTPCRLAVINQEDLTGETEQQNLPGSTWQYPNWRRKMRVAVEELAPLAERFAALIDRAGRR